MKYAEILREYIKESRYTLEHLSNLLLKRGLSASREHLSRLQNGKVPPASDDLNKAIAEITGGDPDKLIWYAYIEKAPEDMKEILYIIGDEMVGAAKRFLNKFPGFFEGKYKEEEYVDSEEFKEFSLALLELTMQKVPRPIFRLNKGSKYSSIIDFDNYKDDKNFIYEQNHKYKVSKSDGYEKVNHVIKVPVLGYIAAGSPIFAQEHIVEEMKLPNPGAFKEGELFMLIVKGDSMTGSRIQEGDRVLVKIQPDVENGEIAVVNVDGENATLKKVKRYEDGSVWLIATNPKYAPIPLNHEKARIIGKVIQVIFEP